MFRAFVVQIGLVFAICAAMASVAHAQQKTLGTFGDWTAVVDGTGPKKLCYVGGKPKKSKGEYSKRDAVHFLVTNRPADKVKAEVSATAGYTYKAGKDAQVEIGGKTFKLFTRGGNAWAYDAKGDKALVSAMKDGKEMIVRGTSSRGTQTTDTYSLSGFEEALAAIDQACAGK